MNTKLSMRRKSGTSGEEGIALLMCIFALLLLTGVALALMYMSDTEQAINNNYRDSERAYFGAMAGLQDARIQMRKNKASDPWPVWVPTTMPTIAAGSGVTYITNPNNQGASQPWQPSANNLLMDRQLCNENFATFGGTLLVGSNVPCASVPGGNFWQERAVSRDPNRGTAAAMDYRWVRITRKSNRSSAPYYVAGSVAAVGPDVQMCWNGSQQLPLDPAYARCEDVPSTPRGETTVFRLTSFAMAPGGTPRTLQMDVAENPPFLTNAAVDSQDHVTLNGKLDVNGFDFCTCNTNSCTTDPVTGIRSCTGKTWSTGAVQQCDNTKWAIYASNTVDNPNKSETLVAGPNPPVVQNQPWLFNIPAMINELKNSAGTVDVTQTAPYNWSCTAATSTSNASCGTHSGGMYGVPPAFPPSPVDDPTYNSAYGSCSGGVGPGCPNPQVTYVPGNLQITGGSVGNGILIVDGDLDIHGGLQFYGLILVRGVVKFTGGGSDATNIYGAVLAGQESYVDNVLGGSAYIQYNACALRNSRKPQPPTTISFHELAY